MRSCLLILLAGPLAAQEKPTPVPFTVVERGYDTCHEGAQLAVYDDADRWEHCWRTHKGQFSRAPVPPIDFKKQVVIFVSKGPQSSTGYEIEIPRIEQTATETQVFYRLVTPGKQPVGAAITHPYMIVRIDRSDRKMKFIEEPKR